MLAVDTKHMLLCSVHWQCFSLGYDVIKYENVYCRILCNYVMESHVTWKF